MKTEVKKKKKLPREVNSIDEPKQESKPDTVMKNIATAAIENFDEIWKSSIILDLGTDIALKNCGIIIDDK